MKNEQTHQDRVAKAAAELKSDRKSRTNILAPLSHVAKKLNARKNQLNEGKAEAQSSMNRLSAHIEAAENEIASIDTSLAALKPVLS